MQIKKVMENTMNMDTIVVRVYKKKTNFKK